MITIEHRKVLFLNTLGCGVRIECRDPAALELLVANYGHMGVYEAESPKLEYMISRPRKASGFCIARRGSKPLMAADDGEFLFLFEKDLTIQLQKMRRDLYFLHAGALGFLGGAFLLVGASGKGKSTTTWALLHHGFRYLSDELSPLNLDIMEVQPYSHAICLKNKPPWPYCLPDQILRTASTVHIPTPRLPNNTISNPMPVRAIFFLEYSPSRTSPSLRHVSKAESTARLFAHALNPLAHPENGLAGAAAIAQNVASFCLVSGELSLTCELIARTLESAATKARPSALTARSSVLTDEPVE